MSSITADPLEALQRLEKRLGFSHTIRILQEIENENSSLYVLVDRDLSGICRYLDTLQRIEEEYGSFSVFSNNAHLLKTAERIHQEGISSSHANGYLFLEGPPDVTNTMRQIIRNYDSFYEVLNGFHSMRQIIRDYDSFNEVLHGFHFSKGYCRSDTVCWVFESKSKSADLLRTLRGNQEEFDSFSQFLDRLKSKYDLLGFLRHIEEEESFCWSSLRFSLQFLRFYKRSFSFRKYSERIRSNISSFLETTRRIGEEWSSLLVSLETAHRELDLMVEFLKREFKFLRIILNLHYFKYEPHLVQRARDLFDIAASRIVFIQEGQNYCGILQLLSGLPRQFQDTKSRIRRTGYSFCEVSFQLLANKDGIVIPNLVMKFIDPVAENLSDLLKVKDPSSPLCVKEPLKGQIKKALGELNFLKSFVYFVSGRWIEPQSQLISFNHILEVAWHKTMLAWLYLSSLEGCHDSLHEEINSLFSKLQRERIQTQRSVCKIYIGVLQAVKLVQLQWYPVFQIKHIVDCEVGFVDALLHNLEELTISSNFIARKETLQEMLNILRANLINLPVQVFLFHLQHINSVIVDAGILVCSLTDVGETYQALPLDFSDNIQSIQAVIYLIIRKSFFLQSNLTRTDGLNATDFSLENLKGLLSRYSDSIVSVQSKIQTIQNELKCFQADVEKQDELQHFAAAVIGLAYEVEHISDACKEKKIPDCCLVVWILHIEEDIRLLMAEVAEIQEENVLPNTKDDPLAHTSSQFAKNPDMNEETVGLMDVMNELRGKLTGGSSELDVISIFGMAGVGKTTLANKLYLDQSVVSHFDIRAQVCVSQEYTRKDMLLTILGDKNAKLGEEAENELADKLKKKLCRKRYLIFVDDIWHTSAWDELWSCFRDDINGSRIILTTRECDVASYAKLVSDPFELLPLSSDESWALLQNKVFNKEECPTALQNVGIEIAQKCCGLPLSIILVAGILTRMEKEEQCWEQVMTNLAQHIGTLSDYTIDLSYQNLPDHLKPCFLYFGLFSEDKEIQVSKLTWLWISEGFVTTHTEKLLEVVAKDYLENLVGRNLVMVAKKSFDGKIKTCRVHDLLFEFCRKKAKLNNFSERIKWDKGVDMSHVFPSKYRIPRLSLHSQCDNLQIWCSSFSHVKSFQFREARKIAFSSIDHASYTFRRFKFLRVLDIEFTIIDSFPQELTLLRYLAFRTAEDAISLPANLWNLETLIVQGIRGRVSLPDTIWKMVKLRHLHIYDQVFFTLDSGQELSESPSTMNALQTISSPCFSCVDNADKILAKTPNLQKLRCKVLKFDGSFPAFDNLTELEMLKISSGTRTLINQLKFPSKLKKLTLSNFHIDLTKVATLLELEVLKLLGVTVSSNIWKVNAEQFLKLKFLKLENLSFSEWDVSDDAFPCLEHLVLKNCRNLKVIPSCFEYSFSLKSVEIIACDEALAMSAKDVRKTFCDMTGYSGFQIVSDFKELIS